LTTTKQGLRLEDVHVEFKRRGRAPVRAVAGVNLRVEPGQIVGLVGETGCGKSTLARVAVGLARPTSGTVWLDGEKLRPLGYGRRNRHDARLQIVFQNPFSSLNPRRKVGDQIADGPAILDRASRRSVHGRVLQILEQVGIPKSAADRFPHEFSGGQRQRIAIARVLAASPEIVVLDEPLSSLDASAQAQVANLLVRLSRELHVGLLLISHDLAIVHHVADLVAVMYLGQIVEAAPTKQLWSIPLHPYSEALIQAAPRAGGPRILPNAVAGEVPDPAYPPPGCRFHPRCQYAFDRCRSEWPALVEIAKGRSVACWLQAPGDLQASPSHKATSHRADVADI
jgi:oligopeptide/dipeptide ABC transporter ATP-binding protein